MRDHAAGRSPRQLIKKNSTDFFCAWWFRFFPEKKKLNHCIPKNCKWIKTKKEVKKNEG